MTLDAALRELVREVIRDVVKEELVVRPPVHPAPSAMESMHSVAAVARILAVKEKTIRSWIQRGLLLAIRAGRTYRVQQAALDEFLRNRPLQTRKATMEEQAGRILNLVRIKRQKATKPEAPPEYNQQRSR